MNDGWLMLSSGAILSKIYCGWSQSMNREIRSELGSTKGHQRVFNTVHVRWVADFMRI